MFTYDPIVPDSPDIRLVRILERQGSESRIALEIRNVSMENCPYAALSYVWGDSNIAMEIDLNGVPFAIGGNLYSALEQLWNNGFRSWLWVDSICIEQSNAKEKNHEVGRMHTIFSQADCVYAWLGPGCFETDRAMEFISCLGPQASDMKESILWDYQTISACFRKWKFSKHQTAADIALESKTTQFVLNLFHEPALRGNTSSQEGVVDGINNIMLRDYWHRIWINQEISLAKEVMMLCGTKSVSLDMLRAILEVLQICVFEFRHLRSETNDFAWDLNLELNKNRSLDTRTKYRQKIEIRLSDIVHVEGSTEKPLYSASDPRDICFGLLGVLTHGHAVNLHPEYTLSVTQVFIAMTRAMIYDSDEGDWGYHLDCSVPREENPHHLPSWVPDWQEIGKVGFRVSRVNSHRYFDATVAMPTPMPVKISSDDALGCLRRPGCRVDVVTEVMQLPERISKDSSEESWIVTLEELPLLVCEFTQLGAESSPGEDYVWRTISTVRMPHQKNPFYSKQGASVGRKLMRRQHIDTNLLTPDQKETICALRFMPPVSTPQTLDSSISEAQRHMFGLYGIFKQGRTLFKTAKNMFGLGHLSMQPGDVVTLIWGVRSPLILRPRSDSSDRCFALVGDAYVDGIMHGEFLKTLPAHEEFEIY